MNYMQALIVLLRGLRMSNLPLNSKMIVQQMAYQFLEAQDGEEPYRNPDERKCYEFEITMFCEILKAYPLEGMKVFMNTIDFTKAQIEKNKGFDNDTA